MTKINIRARVKLRVGKSHPRRWTPQYRLRVALANNNRGMWWICLSRRSVADMERRFKEGSVASVLYTVVGGILGDHQQLRHGHGKHYLFMQLVRRDYFVELSLRELGIQLVEPIAFNAINYY